MSTSTVLWAGKDGVFAHCNEYGNAWGGAALIWDYFHEKYVKKPRVKEIHGYDPDHWMFDQLKAVCALLKRDDLPEYERAVLLCTMDGAVLKAEDFARFAEHLNEFAAAMPSVVEIGKRVNHIPRWAERFASAASDETTTAAAWWHTSVANNPWWVTTDEESGDGRPYNLLIDKGNHNWEHWFLYDEVEVA